MSIADHTQIAVDLFNKYAEQYQQKFMDVSLYKDTIDKFCEAIAREDAAILDVACGPGNISKYLLEQHPKYKITGIDLAPQMLELAKANVPGADLKIMDGREIKTMDMQYHGIVCGFFLPYLTRKETGQFIADVHGLLHPGGILYLSAMEGDEYMSGMETSAAGDQLYINYHEAAHLSIVLKDTGFTILDVQRKLFVKNDGKQSTDLILIARK